MQTDIADLARSNANINAAKVQAELTRRQKHAYILRQVTTQTDVILKTNIQTTF